MKTYLSKWLLLVGLLTLGGCQAQEGSEWAARAYIKSQTEKWMHYEPSEVESFKTFFHSPPIRYSITNVYTADPDKSAHDKHPLPANWEEWPAYKFEIELVRPTESGGELSSAYTYRLTWNPLEKRWFMMESR